MQSLIRRSGLLKATALFAFAILLWVSSIVESKKRFVATRLLEEVSLNSSIRLANCNIFSDNTSVCWILFSRSMGLFQTSRALAPDLLNTSTDGTDHVLVGIGVFFGFLSTAVQRLRRFGFAGVGIVVVGQENLKVPSDSFFQLLTRNNVFRKIVPTWSRANHYSFLED